MSADSGTIVASPTTTSVPGTPDPALLDDLVAANRILSDHGVLDAYGHISARDPVHHQHYWISRSMPPAQVGATDIIACDLDNNPVRPGETRLFFERVIHGEIYKARPDVMAVLHDHSPSLIPFCNSDTRLRPWSAARPFWAKARRCSTSGRSTTRAISTSAPRRRPRAWRARSAPMAWCCCAATGRSRSANRSGRWCAAPSSPESNAKQQMQATMLGPVHFLTDSEIAFAKRMKPKDPDRAWRLWKQRAMGGVE